MICHKPSLESVMLRFQQEACYGKPTQNGYGERNIGTETMWLVRQKDRPGAGNQPGDSTQIRQGLAGQFKTGH
jgi:hypothetical protein